MQFDLAVIGNDESAIELGLAAATLRKNTVVVLPESRHSSWMMCQAMRRVTSTLLADRSRARQFLFSRGGTPGLIKRLLGAAVTAETADLTRLLQHAGAAVLIGETRFLGPRQLAVSTGVNCSRTEISSLNSVIATGTRYSTTYRTLGLVPPETPESLLEGAYLPTELQFVGGDDFSAAFASVLSLFGVDVTVVIRRPLDSAFAELADQSGVRFRYDLRYASPGTAESRSIHPALERSVDCRRQLGFTDHLNLTSIGVEADEHGQLWCSSSFETWCDNVFGIGSVVGFGAADHLSPTQQAERVIHRIHHQLSAPHFLKTNLRIAKFAETN